MFLSTRTEHYFGFQYLYVPHNPTITIQQLSFQVFTIKKIQYSRYILILLKILSRSDFRSLNILLGKQKLKIKGMLRFYP